MRQLNLFRDSPRTIALNMLREALPGAGVAPGRDTFARKRRWPRHGPAPGDLTAAKGPDLTHSTRSANAGPKPASDRRSHSTDASTESPKGPERSRGGA